MNPRQGVTAAVMGCVMPGPKKYQIGPKSDRNRTQPKKVRFRSDFGPISVRFGTFSDQAKSYPNRTEIGPKSDPIRKDLAAQIGPKSEFGTQFRSKSDRNRDRHLFGGGKRLPPKKLRFRSELVLFRIRPKLRFRSNLVLFRIRPNRTQIGPKSDPNRKNLAAQIGPKSEFGTQFRSKSDRNRDYHLFGRG